MRWAIHFFFLSHLIQKCNQKPKWLYFYARWTIWIHFGICWSERGARSYERPMKTLPAPVLRYAWQLPRGPVCAETVPRSECVEAAPRSDMRGNFHCFYESVFHFWLGGKSTNRHTQGSNTQTQSVKIKMGNCFPLASKTKGEIFHPFSKFPPFLWEKTLFLPLCIKNWFDAAPLSRILFEG